jgi:hypothetical protein
VDYFLSYNQQRMKELPQLPDPNYKIFHSTWWYMLFISKTNPSTHSWFYLPEQLFNCSFFFFQYILSIDTFTPSYKCLALIFILKSFYESLTLKKES